MSFLDRVKEVQVSAPTFVDKDWARVAASVLLSVMAAACLSAGDICIFSASKTSSTPMIFTANALVGLLLCVTIIPCRIQDFASIYPGRHWIIFSGFIQTIAQFALLYAISHLGPGDAKALYFTMPVFAIALSYLFLGYAISKTHVFCATVALLGVVLVSRSQIDPSNLPLKRDIIYTAYLIFLALFSAFLLAGVFVIRKHLAESAEIGALPLLLAYFFEYSLASSLSCTVSRSWGLPDNLSDVIVLCGSGAAAFFGTLLIFAAIQLSDPSTVTIILPLNVVTDYVAQLILFRSLPLGWTTIAGASLIICSSVGVAVASIFENVWGEQQNRENSTNEEKQCLTKD